MLILKRGIPVILAVIAGLTTLISLLFWPDVADRLLDWAGFVAAAALLLGILNLLSVHVRRLAAGDVYSLVLILSMVSVFALAITDAFGQTQGGVQMVFDTILAPLESALASLVAFFLLFASVRMARNRLNAGMGLFLISTLFFLLTQDSLATTFWEWILPVRAWLDSIVVVAGMRGLLLGIALGVIILAARLLLGIERPYSS